MRIRTLTGRNWGVSMRYRISRLNRYISSWMAYFRFANTPNVFSVVNCKQRRMAATASETGLLEAMEEHQDQTCSSCQLGYQRRQSPILGCVVQRPLATGQHVCAVNCSFQCVLDRCWPGRHQIHMVSLEKHMTNRRMRARMSGGVGGGRETRPPTQCTPDMGSNLEVKVLWRKRWC